jgi:hypothetical protein
MKNYLSLKRLSAAVVSAIFLNSGSNCQTLLIENFSYPAGTALTANGWNAHSGAGTNPVKVHSFGLAFPGYPSSEIGLSAILNNNGEDVNITFTPVTTGCIYCAFLVKVNAIDSGYFFHLGPKPVGTNHYGKVFICGTGNFLNFGLSKGTKAPVLTTGSTYATGLIYLIVLKYSIVEGASNDIVSLFIISGSIPGAEPVLASIGPLTDASQTDLTSVAAIALRQYSSKQDIIIDGIRVATRWEDAVSSLTTIKHTEPEIPNLVYPSPASGEINIENCADVNAIEIFNLSGDKVVTVNNDGNSIVKIAVNQLINGLYIIRLKSSKGYSNIKFVKS